MIKLLNKETNVLLGELTESQLQFLIDQLEEEDSADQDYWISPAQLELFKDEGADHALLVLLETAIAGTDGVEVIWQKA
ncbi:MULTISPECIES: hypothetical protein [unclassified Motilimonas]|uniref:hypothetical protein n=1 Tax=Motilimonas TaxID=1914248 RepID=UPI001E50CB2D|nr:MULTISPECIES: hypothetical protein [unclassified Motilimonas]MCE0555538.1 hypothetical protein [Motilimonas sp. E26]MDO6526922.1 hypothetical protein [Motilimonas sp. 1_MG-2023]